MNPENKFLALTFVVLVLLSGLLLFLVNSDKVYAVSKQSVPEWAVKLIDYSRDIPPYTTTSISRVSIFVDKI